MTRFVDRLIQDGIHQPIEVIVDPDESDLVDIRQKRLRHHWWIAQRERSGLPVRSDINRSFLDGIADFVAVVSKIDNALRYESFGKSLADAFGRDMTGEEVESLPPSVGQTFRAVYLLSEHRRVPVFTRHTPPPGIPVDHWLRLVVPLGDADRTKVGGFIVCSIPVTEPDEKSPRR
jgi:hypothetical protein